jgi:hypothetical protein
LQQLDTEDHRDIDIFGFDYQGGFVLEPKRGLYRSLKVVDVALILMGILAVITAISAIVFGIGIVDVAVQLL